jgi:hypothetical protein
MVFAMICATAMVPATARLPPITQAMTKVAKLPVTRQVRVLAMLRIRSSFNYSNAIYDAHASFAGHIPFLYAIF